METGPQLKVSSDRLVEPGIEPAIPGLQGKRFIHYTTAAAIWENCVLAENRKLLKPVLGGMRVVTFTEQNQCSKLLISMILGSLFH